MDIDTIMNILGCGLAGTTVGLGLTLDYLASQNIRNLTDSIKNNPSMLEADWNGKRLFEQTYGVMMTIGPFTYFAKKEYFELVRTK